MRRRLKIAGLLLGGLLVVGGVLGYALYPNIAVWFVKTRVLPKLAARLGRDVAVRSIHVTRDHIVLEGVTVTGPHDLPGTPLATVDKITADYDAWTAFREHRLGKVVVDAPSVQLYTAPDGLDNWTDLRARLHGGRAAAGGGGGWTVREIVVSGGMMRARDDKHDAAAQIAGFEGSAWPRGPAHLALTGVSASVNVGHHLEPKVAVDSIQLNLDLAHPRTSIDLQIAGGSVQVTPKLSFTGIAGDVASTEVEGQTKVSLRGGYGGVVGELWHADGWLAPFEQDGSIQLTADKFTLDRVEQVLVGTPIQHPEKTTIAASLAVTLAKGDLAFDAKLDVAGLTIYHPWLADDPLKDLAWTSQLKGRYTRLTKTLSIDDAQVTFHGLTMKLDGEVALPGGRDAVTPVANVGFVAVGFPFDRPKVRVRAHLVIPKMKCQAVLDAIPKPIVPKLQGFKLAGNFDTNLFLDIDWANLDALQLGGGVGIFGCKVVEPSVAFDATKLKEEFDQTVEVEKDKSITFKVGPTNPDFVPIDQISAYLVNSLETTEDATFEKHHGFIPWEFRTALLNDLKAGYFKFGASSITMQMVKNVYLYRQKTLSRKLQELFLTWYVETVLDKKRIMEIYLNVIEFGPNLYGIGPAARHYFGKPASEINPTEAAFFSSILPDPKGRYIQYCEGKISKRHDDQIQMYLRITHERKLLTDDEYTAAIATPLVFDRTEALPEDQCIEETRKLIKNARPTMPTTQPQPAKKGS